MNSTARALTGHAEMTAFARALTTLVLLCVIAVHPAFVAAAGSAFQTGDVFAGVGGGKIHRFDPSGLLLDILDTGASGTEDTGMAFDASGNLYATVFQANNLYRFDHNGILVGPFGTGYNQHPESIVFDRNGNAYVGQADGAAQVLKFSSSGALAGSYNPQRDDRGTDWLDLAADQCTLHYTSEGDGIKQFNVCTNTQMADFATGLSGPCYAHRIRPNFEELVACTRQVYRLNSSGGIVQTYQITGTSLLFALNLDPDNKTFWTADYFSGMVFRIDIATGTVVTQFNAGPVSQSLAGLTVAGEITSAVTAAPPSTTSYYVKTRNSKSMNALGASLAAKQIATGVAQDSIVVLLFGDARVTTDLNSQPVYGATGYRQVPVAVGDVASLTEAFAAGYYNALGGNTTLHVRIAVGTNNHDNQGTQLTADHGAAWGGMINDIASWVVSQGYAGQVDIAGAFDAEPGYNTYAPTIAWVNAYASVAKRFLYDVGDSGGKGCPQVACEHDWNAEKLWTVSWGATPSEPLPEIYRESGVSAAQWKYLSLYGYQNHSQNMIISGALTTFGTCNPDAACRSAAQINNTPSQGWQQLYGALNADPSTAQTLPWSTDLAWSSQK